VCTVWVGVSRLEGVDGEELEEEDGVKIEEGRGDEEEGKVEKGEGEEERSGIGV